MTAGPHSLSSLYPADAFAITTGEPVAGGLRGAARHFFCPNCMSWLFTQPEDLADFINVRSTKLDGASRHRPFIETWTSEKLPWAESGAAHAFEAFPAPESFPALLAAFAEATRAGPPATPHS